MFIVELSKNCWLTSGEGDPPRTLVKDFAKTYKTYNTAKTALTKARKYREFPTARIVPVRIIIEELI